MPLYDLFCLARPALARDELASIIKRSCSTVLAGKGVITDVKYNGVTTLAYTIKKTHGHYPEVRQRRDSAVLSVQKGCQCLRSLRVAVRPALQAHVCLLKPQQPARRFPGRE